MANTVNVGLFTVDYGYLDLYIVLPEVHQTKNVFRTLEKPNGTSNKIKNIRELGIRKSPISHIDEPVGGESCFNIIHGFHKIVARSSTSSATSRLQHHFYPRTTDSKGGGLPIFTGTVWI